MNTVSRALQLLKSVLTLENLNQDDHLQAIFELECKIFELLRNMTDEQKAEYKAKAMESHLAKIN